MAVGAGAVGRLAAGAADRVDLAVLCEAAEVAVDRGESDLVEAFVQLLRRHRAVALFQRLDDRRALNRARGWRRRWCLLSTGLSVVLLIMILDFTNLLAHDANRRAGKPVRPL